MRPFPYTNPKLSDGIRPFLDNRRKMKRHNGHGFTDWLGEYDKYKARLITLGELMEYMNVNSYKTMNAWIMQHESEQIWHSSS